MIFEQFTDLVLPRLKSEYTEKAIQNLLKNADKGAKELAEIDPIENGSFQQL